MDTRPHGLEAVGPPALPGAKPTTYSTTGRTSEHGNSNLSAGVTHSGKLPRPATTRVEGGASVVVRARESRAHGEGRQSIDGAQAAPGQTAYAALQSDKDWLRNVQHVLHRRSREDLDFIFRKLWGFVTDPQNLRMALHRVARNRGSRTAGVDGVTVVSVVKRVGVEAFVHELREELRSRRYRPSPVRRVLIPEARTTPASIDRSAFPRSRTVSFKRP